MRAAATLGVGYVPVAPGTWGSLEAVLSAWLIHWFFPSHCFYILTGFVVLLLVPAIVLAGHFARLENLSDPSQVVIDEFLGQMLCLLWVPISGVTLLAAFLLFRLFDIVKPFPISASERLPGGVGIVADDLIAGFYAGATLKLAMMVFAG